MQMVPATLTTDPPLVTAESKSWKPKLVAESMVKKGQNPEKKQTNKINNKKAKAVGSAPW